MSHDSTKKSIKTGSAKRSMLLMLTGLTASALNIIDFGTEYNDIKAMKHLELLLCNLSIIVY